MGFLSRFKPPTREVVAHKNNRRRTKIQLVKKRWLRFRVILSTIFGMASPLEGVQGKVEFFRVKVGRKWIRSMAIKRPHDEDTSHNNPKMARQYNRALKEDFTIFQQLRKIPTLKNAIPPTVRLIWEKGTASLLLTDLTENGKYGVLSAHHYTMRRLENRRKIDFDINKLKLELGARGYTYHSDVFLVQYDPRTRMGLKVWIVDVRAIRREKK